MSTYPSPHDSIVEWEANELEGCLLDEVGVEDAHLAGFSRHCTRHRLPKTFYSPLREKETQTKGEKEGVQERQKREIPRRGGGRERETDKKGTLRTITCGEQNPSENQSSPSLEACKTPRNQEDRAHHSAQPTSGPFSTRQAGDGDTEQSPCSHNAAVTCTNNSKVLLL